MAKDKLDCPAPTTTDDELSVAYSSPVPPPFDASQTHGPLVLCGNGDLAWLPYSYSGVAASDDQVRNYFSDTTGQALATSARRMQAIVDLGKKFAAPGAKVYIIGHSLGGAVASYWGADNTDVPVLTFDSPVDGAWLSPDVVLKYCQNSVGLFTPWEEDITSIPGICQNFIANRRALDPQYAPVVNDLNSYDAIQQMGKANSFNFAYPLDAVVPSWYSLNPNSAHGGILLTAPATVPADGPCGSSVNEPQVGIQLADYIQLKNLPLLYHLCSISLASQAAADFVQKDKWPDPSQPPAVINLTVCSNVYREDASKGLQVSAQWFDRKAAAWQPTPKHVGGSGCETLSMPWADSLAQISVDDGEEDVQPAPIGILPGADAPMTVTCSGDETVSRIQCDGS